jgi:hypothetical protein
MALVPGNRDDGVCKSYRSTTASPALVTTTVTSLGLPSERLKLAICSDRELLPDRMRQDALALADLLDDVAERGELATHSRLFLSHPWSK